MDTSSNLPIVTNKNDDPLSDDDEEKISDFINSIPEVTKYFKILGKTGDGTFSSVFVAVLKNNLQKEKYALKYIIPTSKADRIANELTCLKEIGGVDNVIGVKAYIRNGQRIAIIMPYVEHEKFTDYFIDMTIDEIRDYMKNLFLAVKRVHQFNIIHRDIKPANFLSNRQLNRYYLVDFGLAQKAPKDFASFVKEIDQENEKLQPIENKITDNNNTEINKKNLPSKKPWSPRRQTLLSNAVKTSKLVDKCQCMGKPTICTICLNRPKQLAPRAGTPGFRAPEVLLRYTDQTTAVDIWSIGVILLSLLTGRYPFFNAKDDLTALTQICAVFGVECVKSTAIKLGKLLTISFSNKPLDLDLLCKQLREKSKSNNNNNNRSTFWIEAPPSAYDLLRKLLAVDPSKRITAAEALRHDFIIGK